MGAKGANNAAHPPKGSPVETGGLTASSLSLVLFWGLVLDQSPRKATEKHYSFIYTQWNGLKYYVSLTIQLNINHLFTHSKVVKQFYFTIIMAPCSDKTMEDNNTQLEHHFWEVDSDKFCFTQKSYNKEKLTPDGEGN